jgi:hypothetical protein
MVVRIRLTIDRASNAREQDFRPSSDAPVPAQSKFTVDLELRTYLGPLLIWVKKMPRGYLSNEVYDNLRQTLQWQRPDDSLPKSLGRLAENPGDLSCRRDVEARLSAHCQCLSEVLWGIKTWGSEKRADEVRRTFRKLANKDLHLELVLPNDMHQFMWEALHFEDEIAGNLSIVRMRVEDVRQGGLRSLRLSKRQVSLLTIVANPDDRHLADLAGLAQRIQYVLSRVPFLRLREHPVEYRIGSRLIAESTSQQVIRLHKKKHQRFNIWFLVVHGSADNEGLLYYENSNSRPERVRLAELYNDSFGRPPDVCILFACDIACFGSHFVDGLLSRDVKLVVAMQAPISFDAAVTFAKFWEELDDFRYISLCTLERAVKHARAEVDRHERSVPVLYARTRYGWPGWVGPMFLVFTTILFAFLLGRIPAPGSPPVPTPGATATSVLVLTSGATQLSVPAVTITPTLTSGLCVKLDVRTFTVDGEIVDAGTTYTITVTSGAPIELIIKANLIAQPPGCYQQPISRWTVSDDKEDKPLDNFQDFLAIVYHAPPAGEAETISVFIRDVLTHEEVKTYLIVRSLGQE